MSSAEITSKTFQIIAENAIFLYLKMALKGLFYGQKRLFRSPISGLPGRLSGKLLSVINCHFQKGAGRSLDDTDDRQETGCSDECFQELRTQKPDQGSGFYHEQEREGLSVLDEHYEVPELAPRLVVRTLEYGALLGKPQVHVGLAAAPEDLLHEIVVDAELPVVSLIGNLEGVPGGLAPVVLEHDLKLSGSEVAGGPGVGNLVV